MHSRDPQKDPVAFQQEIDAILKENSKHNQGRSGFDFSGFVFPTATSMKRRFERHAIFAHATFTQKADFSDATFTQDADFSGATFTQDANFCGATFKARAYFSYSRFRGEEATFTRAVFEGPCEFADCFFAGIADFSSVRTAKDAEIIFLRVNHPVRLEKTNTDKSEQAATEQEGATQAESAPQGNSATSASQSNKQDTTVRMRIRHTLLDRFRFEDVRWYCAEGRLQLQDELDLKAKEDRQKAIRPEEPPSSDTAGLGEVTHEVVADTYRRLTNNFEKFRQYESAEQSIRSTFEMRRRNPDTPWWHRWTLAGYKLVSYYGSDFMRALLLLLRLILYFGIFYATFGLVPRAEPPEGFTTSSAQAISFAPVSAASVSQGAMSHPGAEPMLLLLWRRLRAVGAGLLLSLEISTFQRDRSYEFAPHTRWLSRLLTILQTILIPPQAAIFLLALRRRFRH